MTTSTIDAQTAALPARSSRLSPRGKRVGRFICDILLVFCLLGTGAAVHYLMNAGDRPAAPAQEDWAPVPAEVPAPAPSERPVRA